MSRYLTLWESNACVFMSIFWAWESRHSLLYINSRFVLRISNVLICVLVRVSVFQYFFGSLRLGFRDSHAPLQVERVAAENTSKSPEMALWTFPWNHVAHFLCDLQNDTYERVMSHIWKSYGTHVDESCHIHECGMSHIHQSDESRIWNLSQRGYEFSFSEMKIAFIIAQKEII